MEKGHDSKNCPMIKCKLCHQKYHGEWDCPLRRKNKNIKDKLIFQMKLPKCQRCLNNGHEDSDCLINPIDIIINNPSNKPLCRFCDSQTHYICPFKDDIFVISDNESNLENIDFKFNYIKDYKVNRNNFNSLVQYFINEENKSKIEEEKEKYKKFKELDGIKKEKIKDTNFCCKCGGFHHFEDCGKNENNNEALNIDDCYIKLKYLDNNIHKKNPLKFEPIKKTEYKLDQHKKRDDYYDENDSSGESFHEMYNNKKELK